MADTETAAIALSGFPGSGKSFAGDEILVPEYNGEVFTMGDVVRDHVAQIQADDVDAPFPEEWLAERTEDEMTRLELPDDPDSEEISNWVTELLNIDNQYVVDAFIRYLDDRDLPETVIVDGIRRPYGVEQLRAYFDAFTLLFIDAEFEVRFARISGRGREGEDERETLRQRDENELDWGVRDIINDELYDVKVPNNENDVDQLRAKLTTAVEETLS